MIKEGVRDPPGVQAVRSSSSKLRLELWRAAFEVLSAAPLPPAIKLFYIPLSDLRSEGSDLDSFIPPPKQARCQTGGWERQTLRHSPTRPRPSGLSPG